MFVDSFFTFNRGNFYIRGVRGLRLKQRKYILYDIHLINFYYILKLKFIKLAFYLEETIVRPTLLDSVYSVTIGFI